MKLAKSLIALILVIILGAGTYLFVYKPDAEKKLIQAKERFLVRFDVSNIQSFSIGRPDSTVIIEKGDGRIWNITSPIKAEAENEEILTLFRHLRDTEILYIVEEKPENIGNYGLDKPQFFLGMIYQNGDPDTLFTGLDTPDGSMTYVKFASEERVLTVSREMVEFIKKQTQAYRSRTLLNVVTDDITGIEIMRGDDDVVTLVKTGYQWMMTQPWEFPASESNMKTLLSTITETRKKHFISEHSDSLSKYGLDNPKIILRISLNKGMPDKLLLIGNSLKEELGTDTFSYAKQFDQDVIFTIEKKAINDMTNLPLWYADQFPMQFNRELVNRIVVNTGGEEITLIRDAQRQWSAISPVDKNLEESIVGSLFSMSRFLIVHDIYAYTPTEKDIVIAGLDNPRTKLTFYQNDTVIAWVEFGNTFTADEPTTYCRTNTRPIIYLTHSEITPAINNLLKILYED